MINFVTIPKIYVENLEGIKEEEKAMILLQAIKCLFFGADSIIWTEDAKTDSLICLLIDLLETIPDNKS